MRRFIKLFFISLIFMGIHFIPSFAMTVQLNAPVLLSDMTPIKWVNGVERTTEADDLGWYNYNKNRWANAKDEDGNYWVWIPRFTYKIEGDKVLIKWSSGIKDDTEDGYFIHPAFISEAYVGGNPNEASSYINRSEDNQLTGFWVAKYLASEDSNGNITINSDKMPDTNKTIGEAFEACLEVKKGYGVSSHLIKASEFGAVTYLTSAFGSEPSINSGVTTGKIKGYSNTNNYYGVFDLKGPVNEYLSAFVIKDDVINPSILGNVGKMRDDEFASIVDAVKLDLEDNATNNENKLSEFYGFAMSETKFFNLSDVESVPTGAIPFFAKGGSDTGLYGYIGSNGVGLGFRPTISVYTSYLAEDSTFFDTEASVVAGDYLVLSVNFSVDRDWKFPLNNGEVIIEDGIVKDATRIFDFIDLRYVQNNEIIQFSNGELNEHLIGMIENDTTISNLKWDTTFKADTQYTVRVRVGGYNDSGEPVFFSIPGMTSKIVVESITVLDDNYVELKIAKIPNNKVRLSFYDIEYRVPDGVPDGVLVGVPKDPILTGVKLLKAPDKVNYYKDEPLSLVGGQLEVSYGDNKASVDIVPENVVNYENATSEIGDEQFIELVYEGMEVIQDDVKFIINVIGDKRYSVTGNASPANTAVITNGLGQYEKGTKVTLKTSISPGYKFNRWSSSDVTIDDTKSIETFFTMPEKDVQVVANTIGATELRVVDAKTEFEQGEAFGLGEGSIIAYYPDGTTEVIGLSSPGLTSTPTNNQILDELGTHEVVIKYGGAEVKYDINVVKKKYNLIITIDSDEYGVIKKGTETILPVNDETTISLKVSYDETIDLTALANDGYVFDRWYDINKSGIINDDYAVNENLSFIMPQKDVSLSANFAKSHVVKYLVNDESYGYISGDVEQLVKHGGNATKVTAVPNTGYKFKNWSDDKSSTERLDQYITSDVTYTANFVRTWTVQYLVDGSTFATRIIEHGGNGYISEIPKKQGYIFTNWDVDLSCVTRDIITNAIFEPIISIEPNGNLEPSDFVTATIKGKGIKVGTLEYIISESSTDPGENTSDYVTNEKFEFEGSWDIDENNKELYRSYVSLASREDSSTTITINSNNDKELVRFDYMFSVVSDQLLGITVNGKRVTEYDDERNVWHSFNSEVETVNGKIVVGISYSQDETYDENDFAAIRNLKTGRHWIPIDNEYALNDSAIWKDNYVHIRGQVRDDIRYSDSGVDMYPNGIHQIVSNVFKGNSENVGDLFSITYNLNGGTVSGNPVSYTEESEDITLVNPTKIGATFIGWTGSNGTTPSLTVTIPKGSTGNKSYTANWKSYTYTVTWKNYDGSVLETDYGVTSDRLPTYDGKTPIKPATVAETYAFSGWSPEVAYISQDVTYTAQFSSEVNIYTITASASVGGVISPAGTTIVRTSENQLFTITPNHGYVISDVIVDGESVKDLLVAGSGNSMTYTFTNVISDHEITASFEGEAIAIYLDDNSLIFLRTLDEMVAGDTYNEKTVMEVYTGIETTKYSNVPKVGWNENAGSITSVIFEDKITPISTAYWFSDCSQLSEIKNISNLDTSRVTDMTQMFTGCSGLSSLDVSGFDTSKVVSMYRMFENCNGLSSLDVSGFDTRNVTSTISMFKGCSGLSSLDVSGFDTRNVISMNAMFQGCSGLSSLDVSGFDTSNVTDMYSMFDGCSGLSSLDVSGFDTRNVVYMWYMFNGCSGLSSLDVSSFDTSKVTTMYGMFNGCSGLSSLDVDGFNTSNVTNMTQMFNGCSGLSSLDVSSFNTSNVTSMMQMFTGCSGLSSLDVSGFNTSNVTDMYFMFQGCSELRSLDLSGFDTSKVTDMGNMFHGMNKLQEVKLGAEFSFTGNGSTSCVLPTPSDTYISGADGIWYNTAGKAFAPQEVPSKVADTYYAVLNTSTYIITASAGVGGTISPDGSTTVRAGLNQTFTITPNYGYIISDVLVDGASVKELLEAGSGNSMTYTFVNVTSNHTIKASFESETGTPNAPVLIDGLIPVNWDGEEWETVEDIANWDYNYNSVATEKQTTVAGNGNGKWANAMTADGSLYVWIPRYTYYIVEGYHSSGNSWNSLDNPGDNKILIKFSNGTDDYITSTTTSEYGYVAHPAFTFGDTKLTGIWVAKYEASEGNTTDVVTVPTSETNVAKFVPNVSSWRYISLSNMFDYSYNTFRNADSHLMKNVEWGAVAYLTNAIGRIPYINNSSSYITGNAGGSENAKASYGTTYKWNTAGGVKASTTHNVYGIYDMYGGTEEYVAAYYTGGNSTLLAGDTSSKTYAGSLYTAGNNASTAKYVDIYNSVYPSYGDAVYETSKSSSGSYSWDYALSYALDDGPVFLRGNHYDANVPALTGGIFGFKYGNGRYYDGGIYYYGFRAVLAIPHQTTSIYTVTFNSNGGTGTMASQSFDSGVSQKLTTNRFTRTNYTFDGWNTIADGSGMSYADGQSISLSSNITLYAQWKEIVKSNISVSKTDYSGTYDGNSHTFSLTTNPSSNVTIYYSTTTVLTSSNYTSGTTTKPTRTEAGTTTVYYYVHDTSGNYNDYASNANSSNATITINKADGYITLQYTECDTEEVNNFTTVNSHHGGKIIATANNDNVNVLVNGTRIDISGLDNVTAHEYVYVTITSGETENYTSASATYTIYITRHDYECSRTKPTCTEVGYDKYECLCGDWYEEIISATGHDYITDSLDPTCTEAGYTRDTCSLCGYTYNVEFSATGHNYDITDSLGPTCTEAGYYIYECRYCSDTYTESRAAKGHDYEFLWERFSTCQEAGVAGYKCSGCGDSYEVPRELSPCSPDSDGYCVMCGQYCK